MTVPEITTSEVARMLAQGEDFVLVDVRSENAYAKGHLKDAVLAPNGAFDHAQFPDGTTFDTPLVVYCYIGVNSKNVTEYLTSIGFSNVKSMRGGHLAWRFQKGRQADVKGLGA